MSDKFCKDCKHYKYKIGFPECSRIVLTHTNVVSGVTTTWNSTCGLARQDDNTCGKDGKFFEKKLPTLQWIKLKLSAFTESKP
jgi:hypothetical protein